MKTQTITWGMKMYLNTAQLTLVAEELEPFKEDLELFWDTIEGETDVMEIIGTVIEQINEAEANMDACTHLMDRYKSRKSILESRKYDLIKMLKTAMLCTGQKKIPHALATISLRNGMESLHITNEGEIPTQLCKVISTPDKAEIKKQLKAGVQIEGAELVTGPQTISIRMK